MQMVVVSVIVDMMPICAQVFPGVPADVSPSVQQTGAAVVSVPVDEPQSLGSEYLWEVTLSALDPTSYAESLSACPLCLKIPTGTKGGGGTVPMNLTLVVHGARCPKTVLAAGYVCVQGTCVHVSDVPRAAYRASTGMAVPSATVQAVAAAVHPPISLVTLK